jgi:hypothetical protein
MFLIGGPAFSGTTLLALMLNQGRLVCLDEPGFHKPEQRHRGVGFLHQLFPGRAFPPAPEKSLTYAEAVDLIDECERVIAPRQLGVKACGWYFVGHAEVYKERGYPVIAIVRDIRDALATPLPPWLTEEDLNRNYRVVWNNLHLCDLWVRYEDLVANPADVVAKISTVLSYPLQTRQSWNPASVHFHMLKLDRHAPLKSGVIVKDRVGVWRRSDKPFHQEIHRTASMMGY